MIASSATDSGRDRELDQPFAIGRRGKVRIGNHELVAVSHAREDVQQIGMQQWMDALQHFITLL